MFKSKRGAFPALVLQDAFTAGTGLFLCLCLEIPMYACGLVAVALTDPKGLMPWKGGEA